jgi:hypothetical protein
MLSIMPEKSKIRTARQAVAAFARANRTQGALYTLIREVRSPGTSDAARTEKERDIDKLRKQLKEEMEPVKAFYQELARKAEEKMGKREMERVKALIRKGEEKTGKH